MAGGHPGREFVENLTLTGLKAINATGNSLGNHLTGNGATNTLAGGAGNDVLRGMGGMDLLIGGRGIDRLIGGSGADLFRLNSLEPRPKADVIADFTHGEDHIQISRGIFQAFAGQAAGTLSASQLAFGTKATTHGQHLIYDTVSGRLFYDPDGVGALGQFALARLENHAQLDAQDIILI